MIELDKFQKLKAYDLVVLSFDFVAPLDADERKIEATTNDLLRALRKNVFVGSSLGRRHVVCRVEKPVSQTQPPDDIYAITATLRSIDTLEAESVIALDPDGKPLSFLLTRDFIAAGERDPLKSLTWVATNRDKQAILDPFTFIGQECDWEWLPAHPPLARPTVRDRLRLTRADGTPDPNGISDGAMRALLEYRTWITQRLFEQVAQSASVYSTCARTQYALSQNLSPENARKYAGKAQPLGGDIPGSTELTSDIDMNTFGDGTEFGVQHFNALFRGMFGGNEPGIVFDVNMYGKDFLPRFEPKDAWKRKTLPGNPPVVEPPRLIRPIFDHDFSNSRMEKRDALRQLTYGFVKLRRYMVDLVSDGFETRHPGDTRAEASWDAFCGYFRNNPAEGQDHPVLALLREARNQHLIWNDLVHRLSTAPAAVPRDLYRGDPSATTAEDAAKYLRSERDIRRTSRKRLMATQNRLYEYALTTRVEDARLAFSLLQFRKNDLKEAGLDDQLDAAVLRLRSEISSSLYFANEAYVTAGGVLQVVGGKQQKSRKVGADYGKKQSFHNIAYTVHELMQSAVDQLADIHKEAHRHFHDAPRDIGGTLLATGKYIHRLLNALKHMYALMHRVRVADRDAPGGRRAFKASYPARVMESLKEWNMLKHVGFGLEGLKKAPSGWPTEEERQAFERNRQASVLVKGTNLLFLLAVKFELEPDRLKRCLDGIREKPAGDRKKELAAWLAGNLGVNVRTTNRESIFLPRIGDQNLERDYYRFFETLVQGAIEDYYEFCAVSDFDLRDSFHRDRPPYYRVELEEGEEDEIEEEYEEEYDPFLDDFDE